MEYCYEYHLTLYFMPTFNRRFARSSDTGYCNYSQYCGGNYRGLINKLDYIKGMGFNAIWISLIIENTEGSHHGYHFTNLYNLNYHF